MRSSPFFFGLRRSLLSTFAVALAAGLAISPSFAAQQTAGRIDEKHNVAIIPKPAGGHEARHEEKVKAIKAHKYDLMLIGDSITHNLDRPPYKAVWDQFYGSRNGIDLGYNGGRIENTLWFLAHGELEGQTPKVAVVLIGTNNTDNANYPIVNTPEQVAEGVAAIVKLIEEKSPTTKILLLRIFPRQNVYMNGKVERGSMKWRAETNQKASELVSKLADNKRVFFLDINHVFLKLDGKIDPALMGDLLHPTPRGALLWAKAMEPTLCQLMGDKNRDADPPANRATVPTPKLENDCYDWYARHDAVLKAKQKITNPEVVMIGDSITHFWGGQPEKQGPQRGPKTWKAVFGDRPVLNLGFGWDRTCNVLWRLDHGEFDGLHPRYVVLNIGTNNFSTTKNFKATTPAETAEGVRDICIRIRSKSPETKIILMGVFPFGQKPGPNRTGREELNKLLAEFGKTPGITFLDIGRQFLNPDNTIPKELMSDFVHPTEKGYTIWADALKPYIDN